MNRRELLVMMGGATATARPLLAQQKPLPVIGWLSTGSPGPAVEPFIARFREGLAETGWVERQNVAIEYRWAEGQYDRLPALAADLVSRKVDLIVTNGGTPPALAAKNATSTIPIVFNDVGDPVGFGLVASLAQPGGNLTGFSNLSGALGPKRLEMLCELVPQATVIAVLRNPDNAGNRGGDIMQEAARAKGIKLVGLKASTEAEIDAAFATIQQLRAGGLLVAADQFFSRRREQFAALASRYAIPAIYSGRAFADSGGLISYGTRNTPAFRELGSYAGKILRGAKPADLPVQQPTTFELIVNLKTAKALGLTVPPSILARADEVIE
jgi:putative ABC transport system substrate-binding protein